MGFLYFFFKTKRYEECFILNVFDRIYYNKDLHLMYYVTLHFKKDDKHFSVFYGCLYGNTKEQIHVIYHTFFISFGERST